MNLAIQAILAVIATLVFLGSWYVLQKKVLAGLALVLMVFVAHVMAITFTPLDYAGLNIYPEDVVMVLLATVAVPRLLLQGERSWLQLACAGFAALVALGFVLGINETSLKLSGVECRPYFYFTACALYFLTFPATRSSVLKLAWFWNVAAMLLVAIACYRWAAQLLDTLPVPASWINTPQLGTFRVLAANEALFLWQAFLLNLYFRASSHGARIRFSIGLILPPLVVLLQHRSVWALVLISTAIVMVRQGVLSRRVMLVGLVAVLAAGIFILIPSGDFSDEVRASLDHSLREPLDPSESTFSWRVDGWKQLFNGSYLSTTSEVMFGRHFGRGLLRYYHGEPINFSAHNYYIDTLMQLGAVGLCVLLFIYLGTLKRLRRLDAGGLVLTQFVEVLRVMLATDLIYFMVYQANYEQGIVLGTAVGLTACAARHAGFRTVLVPIAAPRPLPSRTPSLSPAGDSGV